MKIIAIALIALFGLSACTDKTVLATKRELVLIKPDPIYYDQCPKYLNIPRAVDSDSTRQALLILYGGYEACRIAIDGIKKSVDDAEAIMSKDDPKP